jgi:hypothetical protein
MNESLHIWAALLTAFQPVFTAPSLEMFRTLAAAWVLCPGRRALTRIYLFADPARRRAHDAFSRFFTDAAWRTPDLWKSLAILVVKTLCPRGVIETQLDDTAFHKSGRKIEGAGWWRDAVRSTAAKTVHCFGLNLVVLTVCVKPPWGGEPLGLPINCRLHRKGQATLLELAEDMIREVADWFPDRVFALCADGFYAPLAGAHLPRTSVTSRMRSDAALYRPAPPRRPHQRGAPRKKGDRLPTPAQLAAKQTSWKRIKVIVRGKTLLRLVATHDVLWYAVRPDQLVRLVICRDPKGVEKDDFLFTTDLTATPAHVIARYGNRWAIEDTFKNTKQSLGGQHPQLWKRQGPPRAAAFAFALYSLVWLHYLRVHGAQTSWRPLPWYPHKTTPSFADALASLRTDLWRQRLFPHSEKRPLLNTITDTLIHALARVA